MNKTIQGQRVEIIARVADKAERDLNDTRFDWLRTQPRRRQLSVGLLLLVGLYGFGTIGGYPVVALISIIAYGFGLWALRIATRSIPDLPDELVDERMREVRGTTYRWSYMVVMALISLFMATYIVSKLGTKFGGWAPMSAETMHELTFVLFFLGLAVPSIQFAWTESEI